MGRTKNGKKGKRINQRGISWKLDMDGQSFLQATHCLYLVHIPKQFHKAVPNDYRVMECTRIKITQNNQNKQSKGHYSETK